MLRFFLWVYLTTLCVLTWPAFAADPSPIQHVLIISIDGMRPDLLLRGDTPRIHSLLQTGSFTMWARTVPASTTLPAHVSMLTGVPPEVHGVQWNADLPLSQ